MHLCQVDIHIYIYNENIVRICAARYRSIPVAIVYFFKITCFFIKRERRARPGKSIISLFALYFAMYINTQYLYLVIYIYLKSIYLYVMLINMYIKKKNASDIE